MSSDKLPKGIHNVDWKRRAPWILSYFALDKRPKRMPAVMRKYGKEHFEANDGKLYFQGREIVYEEKEKKRILEELEDSYGAYQAVYSRVQRHYVGITLRSIQKYFNESERRQLKRPKQSISKQKTFIATSKPGSLQADNMFFRASGNKLYTVFGMVDVFSRWIFYRVIANKTPWETAKALKEGVEAFEKLIAPNRVWRVQVDGGTEFMNDPRNQQLPKDKQKIDFRGYCKARKIQLVARKQPARMIESTNLRLRRLVERVQYAGKKELSEIVKRFCEEKNETKHFVTKMAPIDAIALDVEKTKKLAKQQLASGRKRVNKRVSKQPGRILKVGDLVRIVLGGDKTRLGHIGPKPTWSKTLYRVVKILGSTRTATENPAKRYKLVVNSTNNPLKGAIVRWRLQYVVKPTHNINTPLKYDPGAEKEGDREREVEARRPDVVAKAEWVSQKKKKPVYKDAQDDREDEELKPAKPASIYIPKKKHQTRAQAEKDKEKGAGEDIPDEKLQEPPKKKTKPAVAASVPAKAPAAKDKKVPAKAAKKASKVDGVSAAELKKTGLKPQKKKEFKEYKLPGRKMYVFYDGKRWPSPVVILEVYRDYYIARYHSKEIQAFSSKPEHEEIAEMTNEFVTEKTLEKYRVASAAGIADARTLVDEELEIQEAEKKG